MAEQDSVDVALGAAIRRRRIAARISLEGLGRAIGVTYQQVQKYETGVNRVSASTLVSIGGALGCGAAALLEESSAERAAAAPCVELLRLERLLSEVPQPLRLALLLGFTNTAQRVAAAENFELSVVTAHDAELPGTAMGRA